MNNTEGFKNILIVGLGLIGGSIAKRLKDISYPGHIYGLDRDLRVLRSAYQDSLVKNDNLTSLHELEDLLIIFCTPVLSFKEALESVLSFQPSEQAVFTDTLSTKSTTLELLTSDFSSITNRFILSHPIAGSERSGLQNSKESLFTDRITVISPHELNEDHLIAQVADFWKQLGSQTKTLSCKEHDDIFAKTSHLPHVISYALTQSLFSKLHERTFEFSGGSLEDYTRIASSDPVMWKDIFMSNNENILKSIDDFEESLKELKELIKLQDDKAIEQFLLETKTLRDSSLEND
jgi:prephenate dehydrogenase